MSKQPKNESNCPKAAGPDSHTSIGVPPKKPGRFAKAIGWLQVFVGGFFALDGVMCLLVVFSAEELTFPDRMLIMLFFLATAVGGGYICMRGFRRLNSLSEGQKTAAAPIPAQPPKKEPAPKPEEPPKKEPEPKPEEPPKKEPAPKPVDTPKPTASADIPVRFDGTDIHIDSNAVLAVLEHRNRPYEILHTMPLTEKEPVINLYEDGALTRQYCLQTEGSEDFTGKYFQISVRISAMGNPSIPVAQIDGFISDTPEDRKMTVNDIGYRMEGHFLRCGGGTADLRYRQLRGLDLVPKGLKYPGYTTPANVRLIGICPECGKSFTFRGYAFYMTQCDAAYSDDGLDCLVIDEPITDTRNWHYEVDGKVFRYYNPFCCPHCGDAYIDYRTYPGNKSFGVSGCVHLCRKPWRMTAPPPNRREAVLKQGESVYEAGARRSGLTYSSRSFADPGSDSPAKFILAEQRFITGHDDSAGFVEIIDADDRIACAWKFDYPMTKRFSDPDLYDDDCLIAYLTEKFSLPLMGRQPPKID